MTRLLIPVLTLVFALGLAVLGGPGRSSSDDRKSPPAAGVASIHAGKLP